MILFVFTRDGYIYVTLLERCSLGDSDYLHCGVFDVNISVFLLDKVI